MPNNSLIFIESILPKMGSIGPKPLQTTASFERSMVKTAVLQVSEGNKSSQREDVVCRKRRRPLRTG